MEQHFFLEGAEDAVLAGDPQVTPSQEPVELFGLLEPESEAEAVGPDLTGLHLEGRAARDLFAPTGAPGGPRPTRRICKKTRDPLVLSRWGATLLHPSHNLRHAKGALWCIRCGCFANVNVRKLAGECKERTSHGTNTIKRILKGKTPVGYLRDWPDPGGEEYRAVLVP